MIEASWRYRLRRRIFWMGDGFTDWLIDLPVGRTNAGSKVIDGLLAAEEWVQKMACRPLGHVPVADCGNPEHDYCAWCHVSTPGAADRTADR